MKIEGFRANQVCEEVGLTYRQLDYWAKNNLVRPSIAVANGSGSIRRYSQLDVDTLRFIKNCIDNGIEMQEIRKIMHQFSFLPGIFNATHLYWVPSREALGTLDSENEVSWSKTFQRLLRGDLFYVIPVHFTDPTA